ncbi:MAG: thiol peroxidase [Proteobacteria bacterium]|nr:thiol peroxidase [Pseudomonadota bacterium]
MTDITIKGASVKTTGFLPAVGYMADDFLLTRTDLTDIGLKDFKGKNIVLNIFPSIDTGVCASSVRRFNTEATKLKDTVVLCVSLDLPFAHARFCDAEGIKNVVPVSVFRHKDFMNTYGVVIDEGPLKGLLARSVVVIDKTGAVIYSEVIRELGEEPDYDDVLGSLTRSGIPVPPKKASTQVPLDRCTYTATAESSRTFNDDEPCDDGRAG